MGKLGRRQTLRLAAGVLIATTTAPSNSLAALATTPRQAMGPFYPLTLPLDDDNDLVHVQGQPRAALGIHTNVFGVVRDTTGQPSNDALIEIWQCDAHGTYHHRHERAHAPRDAGFQAYGTFRTGADGAYRFLTITPVAYPGRAPHIHFAAQTDGRKLFTQLYVEGAPENERDFLLASAGGTSSPLVVPFSPDPAKPVQNVAEFNLVIN
jgi:protocatechuate 3,4-dioxygenase beta subunit